MKNTSNRIYLDYAGAAIPTKKLLHAIANSFIANDIIWANPHSSHELGQKCKALLQKSREKILTYFGDKSLEFEVVFTENATAGLKLLAETFNSKNDIKEHIEQREISNDLNKLIDCSKNTLLMLNDSHTSVVGMRQIGQFEQILVTEFEQLQTFLNDLNKNKREKQKEMKCKESLFVMTTMSNFCGRIYDFEIAKLLKKTLGNHWKICFDAAAMAPISSNIGLSICDFAVISFYKMFGYPTGLGALFIRRDCANLLKKQYFGGGTINYASNYSMDVHFRDNISERFEDGTQNICAIQSLLLAFKNEISNSSMKIAEEAFDILTNLSHQNGNSLAIIYGKGWVEHIRNKTIETKLVQGPIVNFNLLRDDGSIVGFVEVERMTDLFGIQLRTGCHCNIGACAMHLGLSEVQLRKNFQMGKICGDEVDLINGQPLGSVRISFGKNSTKQDLLVFRQMLECCFLSPTIELRQPFENINSNLPSIGILKNLFIYPIKSCAAISKESWSICPNSFTLLHDRRWVIVNKNTGELITQKRYPSICSIQVELNPKELILNDRHNLLVHGTPLRIPIMPTKIILQNDYHNNGILCTNGYMSRLENIGGNAASIWLEQLDPNLRNCELMSIRMNAKMKVEQNRGNFSNQADFLLITHTSAKFIAETLQMPLKNVIERFRPNFVIDFGQSWKPFQEERIKRIAIGSLKFKIIGLCKRCQMICIDQTNGEKDPNVLIGLRNMRLGEKKPLVFGVYLELEQSDDVFIGQRELHTGCTVRLIE